MPTRKSSLERRRCISIELIEVCSGAAIPAFPFQSRFITLTKHPQSRKRRTRRGGHIECIKGITKTVKTHAPPGSRLLYWSGAGGSAPFEHVELLAFFLQVLLRVVGLFVVTLTLGFWSVMLSI